MNCPKCESQKTQPITKDGLKRYCPDCNHSWDTINPKKGEGSVNFSGVPKAKEYLDALLKDQEISPEIRALLETQLISMLMDQWFDGFKGGQLASIVYARSHYGNGKTRSKSESTIGQPEGRTSRSGEQASDGEDSGSGEKSLGTKGASGPIRERVNGIDFFHPRHIKVPSNVFEEAADYSKLPHFVNAIVKFDYDGRHLAVSLKV